MIETITNENNSTSRINELADSMVDVYRRAFAGDPWYERSQCANSSCRVEFSPLEPGCGCAECGVSLVEAYDADELLTGWRNLVRNGGFAEVETDGGCLHPGYICAA